MVVTKGETLQGFDDRTA